MHTRGDIDDEATRDIVARLEARHIFHEVWQGEALLFSTVAHRWEHHLAAAADDSDWVVVADLDEHVAVPGDTVPGFLGKVDQMGYALVHGAWVDRLADGGASWRTFRARRRARGGRRRWRRRFRCVAPSDFARIRTTRSTPPVAGISGVPCAGAGAGGA